MTKPTGTAPVDPSSFRLSVFALHPASGRTAFGPSANAGEAVSAAATSPNAASARSFALKFVPSLSPYRMPPGTRTIPHRSDAFNDAARGSLDVGVGGLDRRARRNLPANARGAARAAPRPACNRLL